jgi:hypothetical protein
MEFPMGCAEYKCRASEAQPYFERVYRTSFGHWLMNCVKVIKGGPRSEFLVDPTIPSHGPSGPEQFREHWTKVKRRWAQVRVHVRYCSPGSVIRSSVQAHRPPSRHSEHDESLRRRRQLRHHSR